MTETYAARVVQVLAGHFPDLAVPDVAEVATQSIEEQYRNPRDSFEFIVDDPFFAKWRLKARSDDRRRVRLGYFRVRQSDADADLERTVNDALRALED